MANVLIDDVLLREPNLDTPAKKPVGNVEIDWNNPLASSLIGYWMFSSRVATHSLVDGTLNEIRYLGDRNVSVSDNGRYFYWSDREYRNSIAVRQLASTSGSYTFEWIADYPATYTLLSGAALGTSVYYFDVQTDRFVVGHDSTLIPNICFYDGAWTSTGYNPCGKGRQHIHFVFDGDAGTATLYVNGVQVYSGATYTARNMTTNPMLFGRFENLPASETNPINLYMYHYGIYERALSADEVKSLSADPYQILKPA